MTFGHGTLDEGPFIEVLRAAGVQQVVDVRTAPGSRRHPHFRRQAMEEWLPAAGLGYRWEPALGGLRNAAPDAPHIALRHSGFRAYADHTGTPAFATALDGVVAAAGQQPT